MAAHADVLSKLERPEPLQVPIVFTACLELWSPEIALGGICGVTSDEWQSPF